MNVSCQSIINPERPGQGIMDLCKAGFDSIMLRVEAYFPQADAGSQAENDGPEERERRLKEARLEKKYGPETIAERYKALAERCAENSIRLSVIYAPHVACGRKDAEKLGGYLEKSAEESIALCGRTGCGYVVIEPLYTGLEDAWSVNHDFYIRLADRAREYGVCILLKNQCRNVGGHLVRGSCAEARIAAEWVDRLNGEAGEGAFGFCADMGVCSLCGNDIQAYLTGLGRRVKAVILRDCDGHNDAALLPFTVAGSGTDWLGTIRGLRDIDFDGEMILDFSSTYSGFSPLLRPTLYKLAREVADYFRWQTGLEQSLKKYPSVVLFGAGNMCRNYMKNYGEKYPPLFTCDNNRKLWGTSFCGLEIRSPEALRSVPENCGIFICNIYYREIEAQLKAMGIKNGIEYFNDEYMPSFYFDRLEREE